MSPYSDSSIYYRLLVLCLLENNGALQLAREFGGSSKLKSVTDVQIKMDVSMVAQIVASIPDKARMNSIPFGIREDGINIKTITRTQLEKRNQNLQHLSDQSTNKENIINVLLCREGKTTQPVRGNICRKSHITWKNRKSKTLIFFYEQMLVC